MVPRDALAFKKRSALSIGSNIPPFAKHLPLGGALLVSVMAGCTCRALLPERQRYEGLCQVQRRCAVLEWLQHLLRECGASAKLCVTRLQRGSQTEDQGSDFQRRLTAPQSSSKHAANDKSRAVRGTAYEALLLDQLPVRGVNTLARLLLPAFAREMQH
jgi:hypothetical protein